MGIISINGVNALGAEVRTNMAKVQDAITRLATGNRFVNPGEGVAEKSIARGMQLKISSSEIAHNSLSQGEDIIRTLDAIVGESLKNLGRQYELALMSAGDVIADQRGYLQIEFEKLIHINDGNANYQYNGLSLLDGTYAGEAKVSTRIGQKEEYQVTSIDQYVPYGVADDDNTLLKAGSGVVPTYNIGNAQATGSLVFGTKNAIVGDVITINNSAFTAFAIGTMTNPKVQFEIGATPTATIQNIVNTLNTSTDTNVSSASYQVIGTGATLGLGIRANSPGADGNNFTYSAISSGTAGISQAKQTLTGGSSYNTSLNDVSYSGDMHGEISNISATFTNAGAINYLTFYANVADDIYSTVPIALARTSSGGYMLGGNTIGANTVLTFKNTSSLANSVGFALTTSNEDIIIPTFADVDTTQTYINDFMSAFNRSIDGTFGIGISAPHVTVDDFGLVDIHSYSGTGTAAGNIVKGSVSVTDNVGRVAARGIITIGTVTPATGTATTSTTAGNVVKGDQLNVNGTRIIFGTGPDGADVIIGATAADTRDNLLKFLNASQDHNIGQCIYSARKSDTSIYATYKSPGTVGNSFTLSATGTNITVNGGPSCTLGASYVAPGAQPNMTANGAITLSRMPVANDTVTVGGVDLKFVAAPAGPTDVAIGATLEQSALNLLKTLSASTDPKLTVASYSIDPNNRDRVKVKYNTTGSAGNAFVLDGSKTPGLSVITPMSGGTGVAQDVDIVAGADLDPHLDYYDPSIIGGISNITADMIEGTSNPSAGTFTPNQLVLSAIIGGQIFNGQVLLSGGNASATGTNYNGLGDYIAPGTKIFLKSPDNNYAVVFTAGDSGISITANSKAGIADVIGSRLGSLENNLAGVKIIQTRYIANFDGSQLTGTVLDGLRANKAQISDFAFNKDGTGGLIGGFKIVSDENTISVLLNGEKFSQNLSASTNAGGIGDKYDSVKRRIKGGSGTTITLTTNDPADSRKIIINLDGVADIDISTQVKADNIANLLNKAFMTSNNPGLRLPSGVNASDVVTLQLDDMRSEALYKYDDGTPARGLDIRTRDGALAAISVVKRAIDSASAVSAKIGSTHSELLVLQRILDSLNVHMNQSKSVLEDADLVDTSQAVTQGMLRVTAGAAAVINYSNAHKELFSSLIRV